MAFITLSSTNKDFSFELNKNPKSGLQAKKLRDGVVFGFFSKRAKNFNLYFQDHPLRCSFNTEMSERGDLEYNDLERYTSPECYLSILDKGISIKDTQETPSEDTFSYTITLNSVRLPGSRIIDLFRKDLINSVEIQETPLTKDNKIFKIAFSKVDTHIYSLLQVVKVFLLLATTYTNKDARMEDMQIEKYLKELVKLDLNYQLRNVFKCNFLTPNLFKKNKDLINTSSKYKFDFQCNNNFIQRRDFIVEQAITDYHSKNIVDLGCGEGNFIKILYKKLVAHNSRAEAFSYTAIDTDVDALEEAKRVIKKNELVVSTFNSLEAFVTEVHDKNDKSYILICSEVIEHNELDECKRLLKLINTLRVEKLVITTPNKDFNSHYNIAEDETRHAGHLNEMTESSFKALINKVFKDKKIEFMSLGDKVNDVSSTLGVIIT